MNEREKKLLLAVLAVIVFWGATQGLDKYQTALGENRETKIAAEEELASKQFEVARGMKAQVQMNTWLKHSLPTNADVAESLYQDWLRTQLSKAGLKTVELNSKSTAFNSNKYYKQHTFAVEGEGKLTNLVQFLHQFYQAGHLHRISKATFTPIHERKDLSIFLTIDAIALNDCSRTNELSEMSTWEELPPLEAWQNSISSRDLFALYQSPAPPVQETIEEVADTNTDAAESRLSSMTQSSQGWRMSVFNSKSGDMHYFSEGDEIEIGTLKGTIEKLDGRQAIIATDSDRLQLRLGQTFDQARPLTETEG